MERFYAKLQHEGDCIVWTGYRDKDGYGNIQIAGKPERSHRVSMALAIGEPIPEGLWVLHHCDNPPCCNPSHLYIGTATDNNRDASRRGKARSGNSGKTHCKRGHEFTPENTYRYSNGRACRTCVLAWQRERYARQRLRKR